MSGLKLSEQIQILAQASPDHPALFIADLHLAEQRGETTAALFDFLAGPAARASSLWILGDLFDYWAGDDGLNTTFNLSVCTAFQTLSRHGVKLFFMRGNRDLLIGADFARQASLEILPDPCLIVLNHQPFLLSHGDILCTDDLSYQAYRKQVNDPQWQACFLARPLKERLEFIEHLRAQSQQEKQNKAPSLMDVNEEAVAALLRAYDYPVLIHGHTHLPAHHLHQVDEKTCHRWVLPEWHSKAGGLSFDGQALTSIN